MGRRALRIGLCFGLTAVLTVPGAFGQLFTYGRQDVLSTFSNGSAVAQIGGVPVATSIVSGSMSAWTDTPLCRPSSQTSCTFTVNSIRLNVGAFSIGNVSISELTVWSWNPLGNLRDDGTGANVTNSPFAASFLVDGRPNAINLTPGQPFKVFFDPVAESVVLSGVLTGTYAGGSIVLSFLTTAGAPLRNRPPVLASYNDSTLTTDCVAEAYVDATSANDPNGNLANLYLTRNGKAEAAGMGTIGPVLLQPGEHNLQLVGVDTFGGQSTAQIHFSVKDNGATPTVSGSTKVTFNTPVSTKLGKHGILAANSIAIADRSKVLYPNGQGAPISNLGTGTVDTGVSTIVGSIVAKGPVSLRENATVQGDVTTSATITPQNNVSVTGQRQEHASIATTAELSWNLFNSASVRPSQLTIGPDASNTLPPGTYGPVSVQPRSTLLLQAGVYDMTSLTAESGSTIHVVGNGPTILILQSGFTFRGTMISDANAANVLTVYQGASDASIEFPWVGTIVAKNALVRIGATVPQTFVGSYVASRVEVRPDTTIQVVPFNWQVFKQARQACSLLPVAECKHTVGSTIYARFGYMNSLKYEGVGLLPGMFNRIDGATASVNLPYAFQPGQVHGAVEVPMGTSPVSWVLGYRYATATGSLPTCP